MSVFTFGPDIYHIGGYSLDGMLGDRKGNGVIALSVGNAELPFTERDIISPSRRLYEPEARVIKLISLGRRPRV